MNYRLILFFLGLFSTGLVSAVPISSPGAINSSASIIDFESLPVGTLEPITIEGVTFTDNNASVSSGIRPQGWTQYAGIFEGQFFGLGVGDRGFIVDFDAPVSEFGMGIFDPNYIGNVLTAYDSSGNILEQITSGVDPEFPVGPPGGGFSTFAGFVRASEDISRIELTHVSGDWLGIDNVTYYRTPSIPEPASLMLLSMVLLGGFALQRRIDRLANSADHPILH